jgi:hypothetical protein
MDPQGGFSAEQRVFSDVLILTIEFSQELWRIGACCWPVVGGDNAL